MKKIIVSLFALFCASAFGTTYVPVQLLNPAGSTVGQAAVSTGPTTPPTWGNVSASTLAAQAANTVVANITASGASPTAVAIPTCNTSTSALQYTSGTGFTCYANSASLTGAAFTGNISAPGLALTEPFNNTATLTVTNTGTNGANIRLVGNGATTPSKTIRAVGGILNVVNDAYSANILNLTDAGVLTTSGGITNSPISGSTGSFTTLAASGAVSGTGFNNLFASPPNIGATAAATGKFTTLQATSAITPSSTAGIVGTITNDSANAGSVGEYVTAATASTSVTSSVTANAASISLTAGDWEVEGLVQTIPAGTTVVTGRTVGISTTSATVGTAATGVSNAFISWYSAPAGFVETIAAPRTRIKLASTTTVYLIANIGFNTSTCAVAGFIRATRPR